jgi:prepilin-type N-terminal cleavage/methylation domain-containing protein
VSRSVVRAFTLIELLIVVAIIGILAAIAVPNFLNAQLRAKIAKTEGDMNAVSQACQMFHLDHNTYPPATDNMGETYLSGRHDFADIEEFVTFQSSNAGQFIPHLTSPVAYISYPPIDPFSTQPQVTYGYSGGKIGYILTSFGPDRDQHENINDFVHRGDIDEPTAYLMQNGEENEYSLSSSFMGTRLRSSSPGRLRLYLTPRTYDPSNGLISNGDLWRGNI